MQIRISAPFATVFIIISLVSACSQGGTAGPGKDSASQKRKDSAANKFDTGTSVLLDTVIAGQAITISRKGDTSEDQMVFGIAGNRLEIPQGPHRGAELYPGIINIEDPALVNQKICRQDGLWMATFDRIFAQGELYAIRSTKGGVKVLTSGDMQSVVSYNGAFLVDPARRRVICFTPVDPDKKSVPLAVLSLGEESFKYIGSFEVDTQEYYNLDKSLVVKAYLKWVKRSGKKLGG